MRAAADALAASKAFAKYPERHIVFAGASSEDKLPLGALGAALSKGKAIGVCTMRAYCSERFPKRAEVPMLPLLQLMDPKVSRKLAGEACPKAGEDAPRRRTLLFRGAHGTSAAAQEVRARLWEVRGLEGADIKFSTGGPPVHGLSPSVRSRLAAHGWSAKDVRMPFNVESYTYGMLHSGLLRHPAR